MKKIALLENYGMDFYNNRTPYAKYLISKGYEVTAIFPDDGYSEKIKKQGINIIPYNLSRNSFSILKTIKAYRQLRHIFKTNSFDILHTYRLQPNILGPLAARNSKVPTIVCHVTGLGIAFFGNGFKIRLIRRFSLFLYWLSFKRVSKVIVQNPDDLDDLFTGIPSLAKKLTLIKGSGINASYFDVNKVSDSEKLTLRKELGISKDDFVVTFVSRLIWQKGVKDLVEAAKIINNSNKKVVFLFIGDSDPNSPISVTQEYIQKNNNVGGIRFLGKRSDVRNILSISTIFALPSYYREGIPRSLLEAMSMELPIITSDSVGCNLTVDKGGNGILVPIKKPTLLAKAIAYFYENPDEILSYGKYGREKLMREFSDEIIFDQIENTYSRT